MDQKPKDIKTNIKDSMNFLEQFFLVKPDNHCEYIYKKFLWLKY